MNHYHRNFWTIGLLALVMIVGVGCTPAQIAAYAPNPRSAGEAPHAPNSAPNKPAMPVAQTPFDLPGKSENKGKSDDKGRSDDRGRSDDKGKGKG